MGYLKKPNRAEIEFRRIAGNNSLIGKFSIKGSGPFRFVTCFEAVIERFKREGKNFYIIDFSRAVGFGVCSFGCVLDFRKRYNETSDLRDGLVELVKSDGMKEALDSAFTSRRFPYMKIVKFGKDIDAGYPQKKIYPGIPNARIPNEHQKRGHKTNY